MRQSTLAFGLLLLAAACASAAAAIGAPLSPVAGDASRRKAADSYRREIQRLRAETRYWQRVMGVEPSRAPMRRLEAASVERLGTAARRWRRLARSASRRAHHPPFLEAWLCIHRHEGAWNDPGAPYYGGLQMDLSFQRAYGAWLLRRKGTADHWTPLEQIWTAVRAHRARGFAPWPRTARSCGLT
ncbi:MAG: hypothetical protein IRZ20_00425 [Thermoleophilia bacterium]|nr:hypothetical protein [Thermoleophilia bacterium]